MRKADNGKAWQVSKVMLLAVVVLTAIVAVLVSVLFLRSRSNVREGATVHPGSAKAQLSPASPKPSTVPPARELSAEDLFKLASPSVVLIEVFNEQGVKTGTASGFVANESGAIITNYHVIRGAYSANAHFQDGSTIPVQGVVGSDPYRDVAILRVNLGAKPLNLGDSERVQVGDKVIAIGSPLALQNTLSDGLVSGIRNGVIQTSTPISPGSSGGPLLNIHGEVVGIAVAGIMTAENLNFAVPINWAKSYLQNSEITSLADLAKQNTVAMDLLTSAVSVPARQRRVVPIVVDRNRMANSELEGSFSSSGGAGGNIRVAVLGQNSTIYDSGRTTHGTIQLPLRAGAYQLVLDNSGSALFARSVTCDFKLHYVK